jgi:hypothetical protein
MDFKGRRVVAHNVWPEATEFRAEAEFKDKISSQDGLAPFKTIALDTNSNPAYQRCVGHFIDGLDAMPNRPDYLFDHCVKVLDLAQRHLAQGKGLRGVMESLPAALLAKDSNSWEEIANQLGQAIPRVTVDFLAKRLLQAYLGQGEKPQQLRDRAETAMGQALYNAFCKKYSTDSSGNTLQDFGVNIPKAGSFLRLYLSGEPGTRKKKASASVLNLTKNAIPAQTRMQVILSLLLFTARNERAHGAVISPFRTSKANLERYESYYYLMLVAYIFALGTLALRFPEKSVDWSAILAGCQDNLILQKAFFALR